MKPLWIASSLFLVLAYSWFIAMELTLHRYNFLLRAGVAAVIVVYAVLTLINTRRTSTGLGHILTVASLTGITLGFFGLLAALHQIHFEGYLLVLALALFAQSILTLIHTLAHPHPRPA